MSGFTFGLVGWFTAFALLRAVPLSQSSEWAVRNGAFAVFFLLIGLVQSWAERQRRVTSGSTRPQDSGGRR